MTNEFIRNYDEGNGREKMATILIGAFPPQSISFTDHSTGGDNQFVLCDSSSHMIASLGIRDHFLAEVFKDDWIDSISIFSGDMAN